MTRRRVSTVGLLILGGVVAWLGWFVSGHHSGRVPTPQKPIATRPNPPAPVSPLQSDEASAEIPRRMAPPLRSVEPRALLSGSVVPVHRDGPTYNTSSVTRENLTAEEWAAPRAVTFTLQLRNFAELSARVSRGEVMSVAELKEKYLPRRENWDHVAAWAAAEGLQVQPADEIGLTVVGHGTVAQVATALETNFARVLGTDGQEYTSAVEAPSVPARLLADLAGLGGLQPHLKPLPSMLTTIRQEPGGMTLPGTYADFYNSTGLGLDGRGQTIVILGGSHINPEDLTAFWQECGLPTTIAQFQEVVLSAGAILGDNTHAGEETMDVEWASAMAPGAEMVYLTTLDPATFTPWILTEIGKGRRIGQLSTSYGLPEALIRADDLEAISNQCFALLAAAGVSSFAATGNYGSTTLINGGSWVAKRYDPNGTDTVESPSSSPFVTAVGGTTIGFAYGGGNLAALPAVEGGATLPEGGTGASTGGFSRFYTRPDWQVGPGVPEGTMRSVPDVAAVAGSNFPGYSRFRGMTLGAGGTSLAAPIWAGFCALINQARDQEGRPPLGLLGPRIYPLNGTDCFNPITFGAWYETPPYPANATNGRFMIGPDYDLVTGLGSPNVAKLVAALRSVGDSGESPHTPTTAGDFNTDGKADILWSNTTTGERAIWFMNGSSYDSGATIGNVPPAWAVSATGDYNGDGQADILWTNTMTGDRAMWLMNGPAILTNAFLTTVPLEWVPRGNGDFNGDGRADILWSNTVTGDRAIWLMDGSTISEGSGYLTTLPAVWAVAGTADFNGDGKADILWTNTVTGERSLWFMNGGTLSGGAALDTVPVTWTVGGTADFNADGKADILFTNTATGDRALWLMNGSSVVLNAFLGTVPADWSVSNTGDFNGDGMADIFWTNTATGDRAVWLMNGDTPIGGGYLGSVPVTWEIAGPP